MFLLSSCKVTSFSPKSLMFYGKNKKKTLFRLYMHRHMGFFAIVTAQQILHL